MDRPPPYFPQNSLSPKDDKRYLKFKLVVAFAILIALAVLGGLVAAGYYLFVWLSS